MEAREVWNEVRSDFVMNASSSSSTSTAMRFEHIPWLSYYVAQVPALTRDLSKMRALSFNRSAVRYQSGSTTKDLFYYLVRILLRLYH